MIYLISKFPCVISGTKNFQIEADVKYCVENVESSPQIVYPNDSSLPFSFCLVDILNNKPHKNVTFVDFHDKYIFLNSTKITSPNFTHFKYSNTEIEIALSNMLNIQANGENVLNKEVSEINYSHYEVYGAYCVIFFTGNRRFFVILEGKKLKCADYYDEINENKEELYFLTNAYDSLNHGKVRCIKDKTFDEYIVYLDNEEMKVDEKLEHLIFLDCLLIKNYNYCNTLLADNIKQEDVQSIEKFFPEFDSYYPIENDAVILFNKNALAGIYKFEIEQNRIDNIISLD